MSLNPNDKPLWNLINFTDSIHQEYELFNSIVCEYTDIAGFPIEFFIKTIENLDKIYGEDTISHMQGPFATKLIYEPSEEPTVVDIFGFSSDDNIQYAMVPKSTYSRDVLSAAEYTAEYVRPKIGDVIHTLWNNKYYELADVGAEQKIFQAKKLIWEFMLKPYRFASENTEMDTQINTRPTEDDGFPDINIDDPEINLNINTYAVSAADNKTVEVDSDEIFNHEEEGIDSTMYGYGILDE